ncbi:MAG: hypothetical protein AB7G87_11175 [Clostridia bacterium]
MKLKSLHIMVIIFAFIFGGITLTSALGFWKTTNDKVPAAYKDGKFAGQYDPADIRGSYTFADIFNTFDVPVEDLAKAFNVKDPDRYASFQCKELETLYSSLAAEGKEVGTGSVRYFVALYKGLPIDAGEGTYLPKPAVEILKAKAALTEEQLKSIEKYSVSLPEVPAASSAAISSSENASSEMIIKGNTTFKDLMDWGIKKEEIEKIINDKIPDSAKTIRDYASTKAVEFSTLKEPLQKLVDDTKR